jgi:hypothetical protein
MHNAAFYAVVIAASLGLILVELIMLDLDQTNDRIGELSCEPKVEEVSLPRQCDKFRRTQAEIEAEGWGSSNPEWADCMGVGYTK